VSDRIAEQKRYYAERAPEYDDWWYRRGRYEMEPDALARWRADISEVEEALKAFSPRGSVLEFAAGTGIWTRKLVEMAERVVAVDANAETLALNTEKAELVQADVFEVFDSLGNERFDVVFFSFWLSHVPVERFGWYWGIVGSVLRPDGRVFLVDSGAGDTTHTATDVADGEETRTLADGRTFRIVKRRWPPDRLTALVRPLGVELDLQDTANGHFLYGTGGLS
jgi:demethylmenaquinone methyltransferase/2-methoxy-6-polyprenyl-1,4-benzoquinol methylase